MANYDFTDFLSPLDFELLSKDLLEAELGIQLENFSEGRDSGIDLRYAPIRGSGSIALNLASMNSQQAPPTLIVQCKRYSKYSDLKSNLKHKELAKIQKLKPTRYVLTTSISLTPNQVDELKDLLSPFVQSTGDIYGRERLNSLLTKHEEIERRHIKLWVSSAGVLDSIINAGTHLVSREEVERTIAAARIYVRNESFDEALAILRNHRVCIISGQPGIGKTTLARMLLLYFYNRKFDVVKITEDVSEARDVGYHNKPRFYYYDDFLGQTAQADKLNKNEDQRLLDFMVSVRDSKESVFVLTTREYILNQAKLCYEKFSREIFDRRICVIDLSKYSRRIRAQILYNHLYFSKLPVVHLGALVSAQGYIQIIDHKNYNPRLIEYLTDSAWIGDVLPSGYLELFLGKLDNPVEIWDHAFQNQLSDGAKHLLLVLTTMPIETRIKDIKQSFESFHYSQCKKFGIKYSAADLRRSLKELDGTFIKIRKIQDCDLVRFQNPSIRDFMQNLLLNDELLEDVISSLVYFEQAQWFIEMLDDNDPQVSVDELARQIPLLLSKLKELAVAESCIVNVFRRYGQEDVSVIKNNHAERIATIGSVTSQYGTQVDHDWIALQLISLSEMLQDGKIYASHVIGPVEQLEKAGFLQMGEGVQFVLSLKNCAMQEESWLLDDFETLADLVRLFPKLFSESELDVIRCSYSEYIHQYANDCDQDDPDNIYGEAAAIEHIGDLLDVDTAEVCDELIQLAKDIEQAREAGWEDDDRSGSWGSTECSNAELNSMFSTLVG